VSSVRLERFSARPCRIELRIGKGTDLESANHVVGIWALR
jgi:hypothetical protein